jgi:hypothetical protein
MFAVGPIHQTGAIVQLTKYHFEIVFPPAVPYDEKILIILQILNLVSCGYGLLGESCSSVSTVTRAWAE